MDLSPDAPDVEARVNELYWASGRSVNQIADELDVSKGALYAMIRPQATPWGCPRCGTAVVHLNRTALERGVVSCPDCEWDGAQSEAGRIRSVVPPRPPVPAAARAAAALRPAPRAIAAGALLGAAAGLALILWSRRR